MLRARGEEENGDSSPKKRTYELAFYVHVGSSLCGRRGTKGTFYTKGTVGVVVPQGQRALFIPSLFFSNTLDISGKFPCLSCSPFYSVPKIEPNHGSCSKTLWFVPLLAWGTENTKALSWTFKEPRLWKWPLITLESPFPYIVPPPQMKPTPLQAQAFKANKFLLC